MPELEPGTRLGVYEIAEQIGAGGMGEVYRATDTRLKRQVALKVLPALVTADPERLARFEREAEVLASLNHHNIAALYGVEEGGSTRALVMELVDGPTLADRIAQGPMPIGEVLAIAQQIATALAAAHEQGIVHRDLKPANIKLRSGDEVKVLDFGLAKAMEPGTSSGDQMSGRAYAPTITSPAHMTSAGVILGTAAYMSPEQAAGKTVDRRTDLWAFGVVLFEMLTGRRLFDGESVSHVIAAVLKDDPDWTALPADVPTGLRKLLKRCLEKDRRKRLSDAATAALECEEAAASPPDPQVSTSLAPRRSSISVLSLVFVFVAGGMIAGAIAWRLWRSPVPQPSTRSVVELPADQSFTRAGRHLLALSPDGMQLVWVANQRLFMHSFRDLTTKEVPGTERVDPSEPVFSPDGAWIAFWSNGGLHRIPVGGGTSIQLAQVENPFGLSWTGDQILVGQSRAIVQVPANGGAVRTIVTVDHRDGDWLQSPQLIDQGRAVLFTLRMDAGDWNRSNIVVQDLASGTRTTVVQGGTDGRVLPAGVLIYARDNALFGVAFDEHRRTIGGNTVPLERDVLPSVGGFSGASHVAWSPSGGLAYVMDTSGAETSLAWMTRQGHTEPTALPARQQSNSFASLRLSPDGKRVAIRLVGTSQSQTDVWIGDIGRGTYTRLTSSGTATDPVWTPDGARVCYTETATVRCQVYDGSAPAQALFRLDRVSTIAGISRDDKWMLLNVNAQNGNFDLWAGPNRPPFSMMPLLATAAGEAPGELSPDGRWVMYRSDESGRDEIFVRPFPDVSQARWQVTTAGGTAPRWSSDGRAVYFLTNGSGGASLQYKLTTVPVTTQPSFATGTPVILGEVPFTSYDVSADGRILISAFGSGSSAGRARQRIVVVQHWMDDLRSRIAAGH